VTLFNTGDDGVFEGLCEESELFIAIDFGAMLDSTSPGKDRRNRVGGCCTTLFPNAEVTGDGTVSSFGFHHTILVDADGCHKAERAEALCDNIGLYVTVVVLTRPNEASLALEHLSDEIINESVLVVDARCHELILVFVLVNFLENVHEETIVLLQDRVLS